MCILGFKFNQSKFGLFQPWSKDGLNTSQKAVNEVVAQIKVNIGRILATKSKSVGYNQQTGTCHEFWTLKMYFEQLKVSWNASEMSWSASRLLRQHAFAAHALTAARGLPHSRHGVSAIFGRSRMGPTVCRAQNQEDPGSSICSLITFSVFYFHNIRTAKVMNMTSPFSSWWNTHISDTASSWPKTDQRQCRVPAKAKNTYEVSRISTSVPLLDGKMKLFTWNGEMLWLNRSTTRSVCWIVQF